MRTELFLTDAHIPHLDDSAMLVALEYATGRKIDILTLGGDMIDLHHCSVFSKDPNAPSVMDEIGGAIEFFEFLDQTFNPSEKYYLSGNHEARARNYLWNHAPKFSGIDALTIPQLLHLDDYGYTYIDNRKLLKETGVPFAIGKLFHFHGDEMRVGYGTVNVARVALRKCKQSVIFGHFHRSDEAFQKDLHGEVVGAWSVGTLGPLTEDFAPVNEWNYGFAIINYYDDGYFEVQNKKILNGRVV